MLQTSAQPLLRQQNTLDVIGIWGGGFIGLSTAAHYARRGIKTVIYDIDRDRAASINRGVFPENFHEWVGFDVSQYTDAGRIIATSSLADFSVNKIDMHFIAAPTERNGRPWMGAIDNVFECLATMQPKLCIIESTMTPGYTDIIADRHNLPVGVATRRDWFTASENNLENSTRVYCGIDAEVSSQMERVLSIVCKNLLRASSCSVVELTKCLDNGLFHSTAMYASQVATAYPNHNVAEALKLAATHWRLGNHTYFPSTGTGGHCVPLANRYLIAGAKNAGSLTIAQGAVTFDESAALSVANNIGSRLPKQSKIGVLGICYRGDIKVHIESPHLKIARALSACGHHVYVHDPYYTPEEIVKLAHVKHLSVPTGLSECNFVYVGSNHKEYIQNGASFMGSIRRGAEILDNQGVWQSLAGLAEQLGLRYHRVGSPNWLT